LIYFSFPEGDFSRAIERQDVDQTFTLAFLLTLPFSALYDFRAGFFSARMFLADLLSFFFR